MALYKRGKTWHTDFTVNGQRFRQSLEATPTGAMIADIEKRTAILWGG